MTLAPLLFLNAKHPTGRLVTCFWKLVSAINYDRQRDSAHRRVGAVITGLR
jgi:hypothetical protein